MFNGCGVRFRFTDIGAKNFLNFFRAAPSYRSDTVLRAFGAAVPVPPATPP
jgi:hypothetical protein